MRAWILGFVALVAGCTAPKTAVDYRPLRVASVAPVADLAVVCGDGDAKDIIEQAEASVVGTMIVHREGASERRITEIARSEAALRGATHLVWAGHAGKTERRSNPWAAAAAGMQRSQCDQGSSSACIDYQRSTSQSTYDATVAGEAFVLLRVAPANWDNLPAALRPQPYSAATAKKRAEQETEQTQCLESVIYVERERCKEKENLLHDQPHALDPLGGQLGLRQAGQVTPFDWLPTQVDMRGSDHRHRPPRRLAIPQRNGRARQLVEACGNSGSG